MGLDAHVFQASKLTESKLNQVKNKQATSSTITKNKSLTKLEPFKFSNKKN